MAAAELKVKVTPEDLISQADSLNGRVEVISGLAGKINQLKTDLQVYWKGEANKNYSNKLEGFHKDFQNLKTLLDQYVNHMKKTANDYQKTEDDIKSRVTSLRGSN